MKIADKRQIAEVLMWCGDPLEGDSIGTMCVFQDIKGVFNYASDARQEVERSHSDDSYEEDCLEAAYRIIESSPTLRREWFTRGK